MYDPSPWHIREAGPSDVASVALVGAATFLETYAGLIARDDMVAHCAQDHGAEVYGRYFDKGARIWLAESQSTGAPLGYALLCPPELECAASGDIELKRIYTLTRMQGTGLGSALMATVVAAAQGHARLLLGVHSLNTRALDFYSRQGFAQIGNRRFRVGAVEYDDFVLARPLAN